MRFQIFLTQAELKTFAILSLTVLFVVSASHGSECDKTLRGEESKFLGADALTIHKSVNLNHEILNEEQARRLIGRIQSALANGKKDLQAESELLKSFQRFVFQQAQYRYKKAARRTSHQLLDFIQEANLGVIRAAQLFDPAKDARFITYANIWISSRLGRMLELDESNGIPQVFMHSSMRRKVAKLIIEEVAQFGHGGVDFAVLAKKINDNKTYTGRRGDLSESQVIAFYLGIYGQVTNLDKPHSHANDDQDARSGHDFLATEESSTDSEQKVHRAKLNFLISTLVDNFKKQITKKIELAILEKRLFADEPSTLNEIGFQFNVSRERIRQLEMSLKARLHSFIKEELVRLQVEDLEDLF